GHPRRKGGRRHAERVRSASVQRPVRAGQARTGRPGHRPLRRQREHEGVLWAASL
ncbi:MAG: hypothetical protein AVDCRST_MAG93-5664, partial [uncultured Chloroflexia bacterium]